jgi:hypothetical protein
MCTRKAFGRDGTSGILEVTMKSRSEFSHLHFAHTILALVVGS